MQCSRGAQGAGHGTHDQLRKTANRECENDFKDHRSLKILFEKTAMMQREVELRTKRGTQEGPKGAGHGTHDHLRKTANREREHDFENKRGTQEGPKFRPAQRTYQVLRLSAKSGDFCLNLSR